MQKSTRELVNQITDWYIPIKNPMEGFIYMGKENQDIKKSGTEIKIMAQRLEDLCNENLHKGEDFKISYKDSKEDDCFEVVANGVVLDKLKPKSKVIKSNNPIKISNHSDFPRNTRGGWKI